MFLPNMFLVTDNGYLHCDLNSETGGG